MSQALLRPAIARNQFGHFVVTFVGSGRSGAREVTYQKNTLGFVVGDHVEECLASTGSGSYDAKHRLVSDKEYQVALVPVRGYRGEPTARNLKFCGAGFGYGQCLAEMVVRVRETVSQWQMERMGFRHLVGLHDPISDVSGEPRLFRIGHGPNGSWLGSVWGGDHPAVQHNTDSALVFPLR